MADVTISGLSPITPSTGLFLPASDNNTTGKVTLSQVCGVMTSAQITSALGYAPIQQGGGSGQLANKIYIGWSLSNLLLQVDATSFGNTWPISVSGNATTSTTASNGAKAWVNFNGTTGTQVGAEFRCTIRSQYNVSSVVRVSTGVYRINFATVMNNANYMTQYTGGYFPTQDVRVFHLINSDVPQTTSGVTVASVFFNGASTYNIDTDRGNVLVFGT